MPISHLQSQVLIFSRNCTQVCIKLKSLCKFHYTWEMHHAHACMWLWLAVYSDFFSLYKNPANVSPARAKPTWTRTNAPSLTTAFLTTTTCVSAKDTSNGIESVCSADVRTCHVYLFTVDRIQAQKLPPTFRSPRACAGFFTGWRCGAKSVAGYTGDGEDLEASINYDEKRGWPGVGGVGVSRGGWGGGVPGWVGWGCPPLATRRGAYVTDNKNRGFFSFG